MKEKPILPLLLSMAAPMILSMLVNSLYNIIDSIFVAKISEDAMTALSLVFPIQNVVNSVAVGFGIGINVMIAFCLGADQREQADKAASQGMFLSIVHGIILSITGILIMPSFLKLFTNNQDTLSLGLRYSNIVLLFSIIIHVEITFEKYFCFKPFFCKIFIVNCLCSKNKITFSYFKFFDKFITIIVLMNLCYILKHFHNYLISFYICIYLI